MPTILNEPDEIIRWVQNAADTEREIIGDRGNYFLKQIEGEINANLSACYQCRRCTNACPVSHYMDVKPHQVIRYIQFGWQEKLLQSSTIWVCLSCEMCTTFCPNEVLVAETIIYLRNMAAHSSVAPREKQLALFHQAFLEVLEYFGRVNEFWLMVALHLKPSILMEKIKTDTLKEEMALGFLLFRKGKLKLIPRRCKAMGEIRKLYRQEREAAD